jgi:hypothetical protein
MSKRKAPTQNEAATFIGSFYGQHKRLPMPREMRDAFNSEGSLETYAALIQTCSNLSEANPTNGHVRAPDEWDQVGELIRNLVEAAVRERGLKHRVELSTVCRERDEANNRLFEIKAEYDREFRCSQCRANQHVDGSGPIDEWGGPSVEDLIARDIEQRRERIRELRAEREQNDDSPEAIPSDDDGIPF